MAALPVRIGPGIYTDRFSIILLLYPKINRYRLRPDNIARYLRGCDRHGPEPGGMHWPRFMASYEGRVARNNRRLRGDYRAIFAPTILARSEKVSRHGRVDDGPCHVAATRGTSRRSYGTRVSDVLHNRTQRSLGNAAPIESVYDQTSLNVCIYELPFW